mmetsp:Transcript_58868/g.137952  ORF Transcript_58868/g.137952 Transcript_58868/m.137952 type:complete len:88 (+) Transcript_58868:90-353(+)
MGCTSSSSVGHPVVPSRPMPGTKKLTWTLPKEDTEPQHDGKQGYVPQPGPVKEGKNDAKTGKKIELPPCRTFQSLQGQTFTGLMLML